MSMIPAFRRGPRPPGHGEVLYQDAHCQIERWGDLVYLDLEDAWRPEIGKIARRCNVNALCIGSTYDWKGRSLDFLQALSPLRRVFCRIDSAFDISSLQGLTELTHLHLEWRTTTAPMPLSFTCFPHLTECSITLLPAFESILGHTPLQVLEVAGCWHLRELDLSGLPNLQELELAGCRTMTSFRLHEDARLISLSLHTSSKLRVDWPRLVRDLRYLCIGGKVGFPLEEISAAQQVEFVDLREVSGGVKSLDFLNELPKLRAVSLIDLRSSKAAREVAKSINMAGGFGATAAANPFG